MTEALSAGEDIRLTVPLYSLAEAARCLALRPTTFGRWARGYTWVTQGGRQVRRSPVVTALPAPFRGGPSVPFIGLAEGLVLAAFRQAHVPLQQIRPALEFLRDEVGLDHALASRRLYLAGAELLWDYAQHDDADPRAARGVRELVAIRSGQRVFAEVVDRYLRLITYADDDLAEHIQLPGYETAILASGARCFALARQDLTGCQMAQRLIDNREEILRVARSRPGPYFFHVHQDRVDEMPLVSRRPANG
ncbi:hypothetical protein Franean1_3978 [Parafrankia sp. EAN1pec]|uniref:hypothetical protein n=1 Tax=Parafrankia sp. (strain EAN1pec) TaxID=298653 RepID=UPI0000541BD6|nr:hypothetical protein Franean1_3978 [Frankia sp. EAN1pec]